MVAARAIDLAGRGIDVEPIRPLLERIVAEFRAVEIRLFGSRARGGANATSDWDLFVVVPDDLEAGDDPSAGYRLRRGMGVRADVVLCSASEFAEDRDTPNTLAYEAAHFGVAVYER